MEPPPLPQEALLLPGGDPSAGPLLPVEGTNIQLDRIYRQATVQPDMNRPFRPPVFSGPPTLITSTTPVLVQGARIEICGYNVNVQRGETPFQYLRWDGPDPIFWIIEGEPGARFHIASAFAGARTWYYANG